MTMKLRGTAGLKVLLLQKQRYRGLIYSLVHRDVTIRTAKAGTVHGVMHEVKLDISEGEYLVDLGFSSFAPAVYAKRDDLPALESERAATRHNVMTSVDNSSVIGRAGGGCTAPPLYGLASLPSGSKLSVASNGTNV
jgi:lipopolysaccharide transport system ATP-binding protein